MLMNDHLKSVTERQNSAVGGDKAVTHTDCTPPVVAIGDDYH